ncbi:MAG: hypothetical protein VB093_10360, partial [Propionicimonas sp.]|nr:hypothetical protein [Propionicimonas sp.]
MSVQTVLVVGAGREGKGSVGEIFDAAGWKVIFVDSDPKVVEVLQSAAAYDVTVFGVDGPRQRVVNDFAAYDYPSLLNAADHVLAGIDLIALCIYPEAIDECAA